MDLFEQINHKRNTFETIGGFAYELGTRQYQRFILNFVGCNHALWLCGNSVDVC